MLIGLIGVAMLWLVVRALFRKHTGLIALLLWSSLGTGLLTFSLFPQAIVELVMATEYVTRIRVLMEGISLIVLLITFESIRKTHIQERYALLWVTTALVILMGCFFPAVAPSELWQARKPSHSRITECLRRDKWGVFCN